MATPAPAEFAAIWQRSVSLNTNVGFTELRRGLLPITNVLDRHTQKAALLHGLGGRKTGPLRMRMTGELDIPHPVLPVPMSNIFGGGRAGGVSEAGGIGLIDGGYRAWLERELPGSA